METIHSMQHEEAELATTISLNYEQYVGLPQGRRPNGQLIDPLARTFEQRMNNALDKYLDLIRYSAQVTLIDRPEGD